MSEGGPIAIRLRIRNQSGSGFTINFGEDEREGIEILLTSSNGRTYSSDWKPKEGMSLVGKIKLPPAGEIERILILGDWNIYPTPGVYNALISFKYGANGDKGLELSLPAPSVKVTVGTRDGSRIRSECDEAKSLYFSARDYTEASIAAGLLSRFRDESALDCLSKVYYAEGPYHFEYQFIHAIGRIDTTAARDVLNDIANGKRKEDAAIARAILEDATPKNPH